MPMMMTNRDFLTLRSTINNKDNLDQIKKNNLENCEEKYYINRIVSIELEEVPKNKKYIRAETCTTSITKEVRPGVIKTITISHTDMKGSIPKFMTNSLVGKGSAESVKKLM